MFAEVVYVLSSHATYALAHDEVRARLMPILAMKGLRLPNKNLYYRALDLYVLHQALDFEDVLAAAYMERDRIEEIYSYDSDFDRFPELRRVEP
jgi:predicted nucleic acid-binding protein